MTQLKESDDDDDEVVEEQEKEEKPKGKPNEMKKFQQKFYFCFFISFVRNPLLCCKKIRKNPETQII